MDIFKILKEARSPSQNRQTIRVNTRNATNYSDEVEDDAPDTAGETNIDTTSGDDESSDYTTEVEEVEPAEEDDTTSDEETEDDSTDYTEDVDSDDEYGDDQEGTDYTQDVEDGGDNYSEDSDQGSEESEETLSPEEKLEKQQNNELMKNTVDLYYSLTGLMSKLDNTTYSTVVANKVGGQVKKNINDLSDYIYTFITTSFKTNSYIKNLYIYNYAIEAYKINIKMLEKIEQLIK